jgi:predicted DNA-binding transcriptional regulator AlpA
MSTSSTRYAARKLGIDVATLSRYIKAGKVPAPKTVEIGGLRVHSWTEADIERVRALLPKIKNGRTTRHKKQAQKKQSKRKPKQ